jgi:predicted membrane protein
MGHALPAARKGVIRNSINRPSMINAALPRPALSRVAVVAAMAIAAWWAAAMVPAALARSAADTSPLAARPAAARPAAARPASEAAKCAAATCRTTLPAALDLPATQQAQALEYYCGPATVAEMLAQLGRHVSQAAVARELGTGPAGTNWADDAGYPVPDVLNANQGKNNYVPVALPAVPVTAQVREFEANLVADLNHQGGVPLAGNAYEVAGGPHLAGNPVNQTIFHWFDIRGYQDFGAVTDYEDSVHGASSVGWSAGVPAYSSLSSAAIVAILGGRGYDW